MAIKTLSPLADLVDHPRDVTDRKNVQAFGVCLHTTGSGVPTKAKQLGISPMEVAISIYLAPDKPSQGIYTNFPHYVVDGSGSIVQIADEKERARHAGIAEADRKLYQSGEWRKKVSAKGLALWDAKWGPRFKNPLQLFPSKSTNDDYLGIEIIPLLQKLPNGSLFTDVQYQALRNLLCDIQDRHGITLSYNRLVGHEDLEALARWNSKGGWDPGALNATPTFFWDRVRP